MDRRSRAPYGNGLIMNVMNYGLLPYNRFRLGKYEPLGIVYELDDYKTPSDDVVQRFQGIIDEDFWPQW